MRIDLGLARNPALTIALTVWMSGLAGTAVAAEIDTLDSPHRRPDRVGLELLAGSAVHWSVLTAGLVLLSQDAQGIEVLDLDPAAVVVFGSAALLSGWTVAAIGNHGDQHGSTGKAVTGALVATAATGAFALMVRDRTFPKAVWYVSAAVFVPITSVAVYNSTVRFGEQPVSVGWLGVAGGAVGSEPQLRLDVVRATW